MAKALSLAHRYCEGGWTLEAGFSAIGLAVRKLFDLRDLVLGSLVDEGVPVGVPLSVGAEPVSGVASAVPAKFEV